MRVADIIAESIVDGPGIRFVVFAQGCHHNCEGCFNPATHPYDGGHEESAHSIISKYLDNHNLLQGITFSGGECFDQADECAVIAASLKDMEGCDVWAYTGYTYEYIVEHFDDKPEWKKFMSVIDVLVDGKFEIDKKNIHLKFKGSANQRIINVPKSLAAGIAVVEG